MGLRPSWLTHCSACAGGRRKGGRLDGANIRRKEQREESGAGVEGSMNAWERKEGALLGVKDDVVFA